MKIWRFLFQFTYENAKISASTKPKEFTKRFSSFINLALCYENNIILEVHKITFFLFLKLLFRHSLYIYIYLQFALPCPAEVSFGLGLVLLFEFCRFFGNGSMIQSSSPGSNQIIYTVTLLSHTEALYNDSFFIILG